MLVTVGIGPLKSYSTTGALCRVCCLDGMLRARAAACTSSMVCHGCLPKPVRLLTPSRSEGAGRDLMRYSSERLSDIFDRTSGYCHLCGGKLYFCNYGVIGARGAWEVEHSRPKCQGGTDRLNNLYAAHIPCNRTKQAECTRRARAQHGRTRAPLSTRRRSEAKSRNAFESGVVGALLGSVAGPWGILLGAAIGGKKGYDRNPDY